MCRQFWIVSPSRALSQTKDRIGTGFHIQEGDWWDHVGDIPSSSVDTMLVEDDRIDKELKYMRWFYGASNWYAERGVPWRRGYLFYGPPGTGKSSLIRALASDLSLDIASLDIGRVRLTDDDWREAMMCALAGCLIVIEEMDAVFRQHASGEKRSVVSFSGLLIAIDGVAAQEGRALVMKTTITEKAGPSPDRPGPRRCVHRTWIGERNNSSTTV